MSTRPKNRALVYLRRSTDRQAISLVAQLEWAKNEAARHSVELDASSADLQVMQAKELSTYKGLRLDDGMSGADMLRPGFLSLIEDVGKDKLISHLLIYRRDRLARPEDMLSMVQVEKKIRFSGVTIVFAEGVAEPLLRGASDLAADLTMIFG